MGLSKIKAKLLPFSSPPSNGVSDYNPEEHGTAHLLDPTPAPTKPRTYEEYCATLKPSRVWMPGESSKQPEPAAPKASSAEASNNPEANELTEAERHLERKLGVSDKEKEAAAEERRAYIRQYLRNDRDKQRWRMYC